MQNPIIILEGSYNYYQGDVNYSQENFKLVHLPSQQIYQIYAEILSRFETGEFLKVLVQLEMSKNFTPYFVRIEKSIGNRYAQELYKLDLLNLELQYTFQNSQETQHFKRNISAKHYLTSPAVSTCALFTLSRKLDASGRTPITLVSSENEWDYEGPPGDKIIYADYKARDLGDFKLNGATLPASHLCLYESDASQNISDEPVNLYLSKHYAIPYELTHSDRKIVIKNLRKNV